MKYKDSNPQTIFAALLFTLNLLVTAFYLMISMVMCTVLESLQSHFAKNIPSPWTRKVKRTACTCMCAQFKICRVCLLIPARKRSVPWSQGVRSQFCWASSFFITAHQHNLWCAQCMIAECHFAKNTHHHPGHENLRELPVPVCSVSHR